MKKQSILIIGVPRSGTTSLLLNLARQVGRYIYEPWDNHQHGNTYPISIIADKNNNVVKSLIGHKPNNYKKDGFSFLVELVEYFGVDNTIFITRKNFEEHLLSYSNLRYSFYKFEKHFEKTGIQKPSLKKHPLRNWKISDLPEWYVNNQEIQEKHRNSINRRNQKLFKLSSFFKKKIVWYEELYGEDRNLSLDIIESWQFNIDCNLLNEMLNPKFKCKKNEEFRLL